MRTKSLFLLSCMVFGASSAGLSEFAYAQVPPALTGPLPGPADAGRFNPQQNVPPPDHSPDQQVEAPSIFSAAPIPEGAKTIHLTFKALNVEGMTVFKASDLEPLYASYVGKDVTLDIAWVIAQGITDRYRAAGYFLSRAYVPQQNIKDGTITIRVVEGYIGKVDIPEEWKNKFVVAGYINRLLEMKPVTADEVESVLLRLNDLPGYSFRSVLSQLDENGDEGAVKMTIIPADKEGSGSLSVDNYSSRYLGPQEFSASYSTSILPLQETSLFTQMSLPADKLRYGMIDQKAVIAPDFLAEFSAGVTKAYPGFTLRQYDINSTATSESVGIDYQWLRQRQENLVFKLTMDHRDVRTTILDTLLTQDTINALRLNATYDKTDNWLGYNTAVVTVSQGLPTFDNSQKNDLNISRAGAIPDFTKVEFLFSRQQGVTEDWSIFGTAAGQIANGRLYSSEQFGYGGQAFGRAYDTSEITGDSAAVGSIEFRYEGINNIQPISAEPFVFYDVGKIWSSSIGQVDAESGSSAGIGMRFNTSYQQSGNISIAWPLSRPEAQPIYGGDPYGPRIIFSISQSF
jgi:hemolysin activation/secretion protein